MDLILSFIEIAAKVIFKVAFKTLAEYVVSRIKERTAPITSRDGSDTVVK